MQDTDDYARVAMPASEAYEGQPGQSAPEGTSGQPASVSGNTTSDNEEAESAEDRLREDMDCISIGSAELI